MRFSGGCWGRRGRARVVGSGLAVLTFLVACEPVSHPEFVVREEPMSPTVFELLSGDGNFAIVRATGAGATVPGAGLWRVDRRDGSVVELPSGDRAERVSRDGSRVLVTTGGIAVLWSDGTSLSPPAGTVFSDDLTFGAFVDADGAVKTWETATQSVGLVEPDFPRPAGTTSAVAKGVSDDGRTVQYELWGGERIERFVDLDATQAVDRPNADEGQSGDVTDVFVLAAGGGAFLHVYEVSYFDYDCLCVRILESWAELVALPSGTSQYRYTNTTSEEIDPRRAFIAADGNVGWIYQEGFAVDGSSPICPDLPADRVCVVDSTVVAVRPRGHRAFDTGPNPLGGIDVSSNGRLLVMDKHTSAELSESPRGPVRVIDWVTGNIEVFGASATYEQTDAFTCQLRGKTAPCTVPAPSAGAQVSDDLQLIATAAEVGSLFASNLGGWYEYSIDVSPAPTTTSTAPV